MTVEQLYTGCLAEAAYYIESNGEAAIIDPLRETEPYIERAERDGATIKYVLETHFHADFVSGHLDLAKKTGATIVYGPEANPGFDAHNAVDGEELKLGDLTIKVLHTPGHTMESTTYLLIEEHGKNYAIFTGDTLFIGDVGRPDLAVSSDLTQEDLAGHLYDSLRTKIMPLEDEVLVYPAHGQGSACGKNMSSETFATLGNQKQFNYALRADMTRAEFIEEVTTGIVPAPQYFPKNAMLNKMGYESVDTAMARGTVPLSAKAFMAVAEAEHALVLDTRDKMAAAKERMPGSVFIGLGGDFAPWVGKLIPDLNQPILFIAEEGREEEVVRRLARVGYDNALGYLEGGMAAWKEAGFEVDTIEEMTAEDVADHFDDTEATLLDVRREAEFADRHVAGAERLTLDFINQNMASVDPHETYWLYCRTGFRSLVAASILKTRGFQHVVNVQGGIVDLLETRVPTTSAAEAPTVS